MEKKILLLWLSLRENILAFIIDVPYRIDSADFDAATLS